MARPVVGRRAGGRAMRRITPDEDPADAAAIRAAYGRAVAPPRAGRPGRPREAYTEPPPGVTCATAHTARANGRVVRGATRVAFGTPLAVAPARLGSAVSRAADTRLAERDTGADRDRGSREVRAGYGFPKAWEGHRAAARFGHFRSDFRRPVRTLRHRGAGGRWPDRAPATAAGLTDRVGSPAEWRTDPAVQRR